MAAAEGDDLGLRAAAPAAVRAALGTARTARGEPADATHPEGPGGHSRPMSRWTTTVSTPSETSRWASFSDIATERCLPPVQPTAMVT